MKFCQGADVATLPSKPFFLEKIGCGVKNNFPFFVQDLEVEKTSGARPEIMAEGGHAKQAGNNVDIVLIRPEQRRHNKEIEWLPFCPLPRKWPIGTS
jgi:hypothetical protein